MQSFRLKTTMYYTLTILTDKAIRQAHTNDVLIQNFFVSTLTLTETMYI